MAKTAPTPNMPATGCPNTPAIGFPPTPAILQGAPPWAVNTPEVSPVLWERCPPPRGGDDPSANLAGGLSKELLRRVCEPFFDQMLVALAEVLSAQSPYMTAESDQYSLKVGSNADQLNEESGEEACDSQEFGAFSSVLVQDSPWQGLPQDGPMVLTQQQGGSGDVESEQAQAGEPEKTIMVCRHWKSKGWCRLGAACKFAHPDHKCGVGAPKGSGVGSGGARTGDKSSDEEGAPDGQKKSSRKRRGKARGGKAVPGGQIESMPPGTLTAAPMAQQVFLQYELQG